LDVSKLALTPELALSILYASEMNGGHTLARHVRITNEQLRLRHETIDSNNWLKVATAFCSAADASQALCESVNGSQARFIQRFGDFADGAESGKLECEAASTLRVRYGGGETKFYTNRFFLALKKDKSATGSLVVITMYPLFGMPL
jgi:hypothetical protein